MCNGMESCGGGRCTTSWIARILVIVGGINWGIVGVGMLMDKEWNVVNMLLGTLPTVEAIVYILVGAAAVMSIFHCKCKTCMSGCDHTEAPGSVNKPV